MKCGTICKRFDLVYAHSFLPTYMRICSNCAARTTQSWPAPSKKSMDRDVGYSEDAAVIGPKRAVRLEVIPLAAKPDASSCVE